MSTIVRKEKKKDLNCNALRPYHNSTIRRKLNEQRFYIQSKDTRSLGNTGTYCHLRFDKSGDVCKIDGTVRLYGSHYLLSTLPLSSKVLPRLDIRKSDSSMFLMRPRTKETFSATIVKFEIGILTDKFETSKFL